jgi:hypothetical protein
VAVLEDFIPVELLKAGLHVIVLFVPRTLAETFVSFDLLSWRSAAVAFVPFILPRFFSMAVDVVVWLAARALTAVAVVLVSVP